ncbi:hypothetical protein KGQ19_42170 [Catenulispora sp. NL8]|uniref:GH18 domain-containing protein n=1 Tax=Catenulispora pinistramenti TaxID=2705254 RepID=A0ABS5L5G0_9ACTN|nr:hypothetical protein [Catenulispora pinistramenti]MBS2553480.1 hypothetical protein [Catenulispora pinistramenti]
MNSEDHLDDDPGGAPSETGSPSAPDPAAASDAEPGPDDLADISVAQPFAEPERPDERRRNPLRRLAAWHRRQPRWRRRTLSSVVALCAALATLLGVTGAALYAEGAGTPSAAARSTGEDALWLGHAWVGWAPGADNTAKTYADFQALAALVRSSGIKDLFVHDGPFEMDGSLNPAKSPNAEWFIDAVHRELPGVRVQAWLGQVVGGDALHLDDAATRGRVVAGVTAALDRGFDGVHFDFEPVPDGDPGYLDVLAATHTVTMAHHALLSASVPQVEPLPGFRLPGNFLAGHPKWWSRDYLRQVAVHCDQVALMAYDTSLPTAWAYRGYVARETQVALSVVPQNVELLIGVPAFHTDDPGHWARAETMPAALDGVRLALGAHPPSRRFGVALYVDFAATPADWAAYRTDWLSPARAG